MSKLKLIYFDFHGGRGEPARLALAIAGIDFDEERVPLNDWLRRKADTPFGGLPVLEVDGATVSQSNGINRYVGKLAGLYPSDPWRGRYNLRASVGSARRKLKALSSAASRRSQTPGPPPR